MVLLKRNIIHKIVRHFRDILAKPVYIFPRLMPGFIPKPIFCLFIVNFYYFLTIFCWYGQYTTMHFVSTLINRNACTLVLRNSFTSRNFQFLFLVSSAKKISSIHHVFFLSILTDFQRFFVGDHWRSLGKNCFCVLEKS